MRTYGWAWLLYLHLETARHPDKNWAAVLEPLARAFAERLNDALGSAGVSLPTSTAEVLDTPSNRGMINKVSYLLKYESAERQDR